MRCAGRVWTAPPASADQGSAKWPSDRDNDAQRLERTEHILEGLRIKMEELHSLATLAQHRADRRVADTNTITDRARRKKKLDQKQ